jgi:ADP-dependent NAD(P)H-hydrate dehydratase / NAD(P)H-hydrate epimerase
MAAPVALVPIYRTEELRAIEASARKLPLMARAGAAAAQRARDLAGALVLAGPGNNGGDAFVVARWLRQWFFDVTVAFAGAAERLSADAAAAMLAWRDAGGTTTAELPRTWRGDLIVDGLFGIGLARALSAEYAAWVDWANGADTPILALDVPSGLDADTGTTRGACIRASATATFIGLKPGLLTADGPDLCGDVSVHALGIEPDADAPHQGYRLDWTPLASALPQQLKRRERNVHKGTFGTLAVIGGASGMVGAPLLAGRAALALGAGKVWIGFATDEHPAVDWGQPELMLREADAVLADGPDVVVCGPGLGASHATRARVAKVLAMPVPVVLDADALNAIAADPELAETARARGAPTLATPHPAEAGRLLDLATAAVQADRLGAALALADRLHAHVVVKGAGSVLAHPDGTWDINASGNPALAIAGTGDVLAGIAGAMLAQHVDAKDALRLAVCVHGAAADAWVASGAGPVGLGASELIGAARALVNAAGRSR